MIDPAIGRRLGERRSALGWTRQELADRLGMSAEEISLIEEGDRKIPPLRLIEAAQTLQTPLSWLLEGEQSGDRPEAMSSAEDDLARFLAMPESLALVSAFMAISCPMRRQSVVDFALMERFMRPRDSQT